MELAWNIAGEGAATAAPAATEAAEEVADQFAALKKTLVAPWPPRTGRPAVASVLLTLQSSQDVGRLERLVRSLLRAPLRPALLRVLTPSDVVARQLRARFRGELAPQLRHRVLDRCLVLSDNELSVDGSLQLLDGTPAAGLKPHVHSLTLLQSPCCYGVWDVYARVNAPATSDDAQVEALVRDVGNGLSLSLEPHWRGQGATTRQLILVTRGGESPRLYAGANPQACSVYIDDWPTLCLALGVHGDDGPQPLVAAWLDRA